MDLTAGSMLILAGVWAWIVAVYLVYFCPMPTGRLRPVMGALVGASAVSTLLLFTGLTVLVLGAVL